LVVYFHTIILKLSGYCSIVLGKWYDIDDEADRRLFPSIYGWVELRQIISPRPNSEVRATAIAVAW